MLKLTGSAARRVALRSAGAPLGRAPLRQHASAAAASGA
jgi:hypothetical protein